MGAIPSKNVPGAGTPGMEGERPSFPAPPPPHVSDHRSSSSTSKDSNSTTSRSSSAPTTATTLGARSVKPGHSSATTVKQPGVKTFGEPVATLVSKMMSMKDAALIAPTLVLADVNSNPYQDAATQAMPGPALNNRVAQVEAPESTDDNGPVTVALFRAPLQAGDEGRQFYLTKSINLPPSSDDSGGFEHLSAVARIDPDTEFDVQEACKTMTAKRERAARESVRCRRASGGGL